MSEIAKRRVTCEAGQTWQAYRKERQASGGSLVPDPRTVRIGEDTKITWHCPDKKE